jgi:hypothetical protein
MPLTRRRGWAWYFVALALLTLTAVGVQVWYNVRQQLTPEQLAAAEARWRDRGPRDYDFEYSTHKVESIETFRVEVRDGKAVAVVMNNDQRLEPWQYRYHTMEALFGFIEDFLKKDAEPGSPRTFATAVFDPEDGHLIHYVRSVMSRRERQEIRVQRFERVTGQKAGP